MSGNMKIKYLLVITLLIVLTGCSQPDEPTIGLYPAVHREDIDQIERHIYWGADINQIDVDGETPLHIASAAGSYVVVKLLLKNGADVNLKDNKGQTALFNAVMAGKTEVAELLIKQGAEFDANDLLLTAAKNGITDRDVIELLKQQGADINQPGENGQTPLLAAIQTSNRVMVKFLIAAGADVNQTSTDGMPPLTLARQKQDQDIIRLLQKNGATEAISR
ncbi:MAG: ankyrin repeat domain-containing protein [Sedimenticola sp.]|jgi:ankyrin repeat protein|nr:MAG: ankyrin repeat domain-containing protein [Sedimenticola sp.]